MRHKRLGILLAVAAMVAVMVAPAEAADGSAKAGPATDVRFASFNASLNRGSAGALAAEVSAPGSAQPDVIAEIIQRTRPDVLLINEFDYDAGNVALDGFHDNYLMVPHGSAAPIESPTATQLRPNRGPTDSAIGSLPPIGSRTSDVSVSPQ